MAYEKDQERPRAPHWMRSMEEKYQRLHARVVDHTARHSQSKNNLSVRLRELRQKKYNAHQKTRCKSSLDNVKDTSTSENASGNENRTPDRSLLVSSAVEFPKNRNLKSSKITETSDDTHAGIKPKSGGGGKTRSSSTTASPTIPSCIENTSLSDKDNDDKIFRENIPPNEMNIVCKAPDAKEVENGVMNNGRGCKMDGMCHTVLSNDESITEVENKDGVKRIVRKDKEMNEGTRPFSVPQVKSSKSKSARSKVDKDTGTPTVNRTKGFKKYSRNSPHRRIHSKSAMPLRPGQFSEDLSAPVFSSMSQEAQHAKHETLKEMTSEVVPIEGRVETSDADVNATVGVSGRCETLTTKATGENDIPKQSDDLTEGSRLKPDIYDKDSTSSESNDAEFNTEFQPRYNESVRQRLRATPCFEPVQHCDESQRMNASNQHPLQRKQQSERRGRTTSDHFLTSKRSPLPAIPQMSPWTAHREHSFNITSPDFDVRFCNTLASPKEEREEPPEDIRRQSIEKCRLWLERQLGRL